MARGKSGLNTYSSEQIFDGKAETGVKTPLAANQDAFSGADLPMIAAARIQAISPLIARKTTSCIFTARATTDGAYKIPSTLSALDADTYTPSDSVQAFHLLSESDTSPVYYRASTLFLRNKAESPILQVPKREFLSAGSCKRLLLTRVFANASAHFMYTLIRLAHQPLGPVFGRI